MPRKVYLAPHLSTEELKKNYRTSEDPVESRRWHLLWKISLGWTIKNSAIAIGLKYEYCQKILKRYNEKGEEGMNNGRKRKKNHRRGKEALLNEEQLEKLKERLKNKPDDLGKWTDPKVACWIEKEI